MAQTARPGISILGIDEATALLLPDQVVLGEADVTVYTPEPVTYQPGEVVTQPLFD
jgi:hypothetical protein